MRERIGEAQTPARIAVADRSDEFLVAGFARERFQQRIDAPAQQFALVAGFFREPRIRRAQQSPRVLGRRGEIDIGDDAELLRQTDFEPAAQTELRHEDDLRRERRRRRMRRTQAFGESVEQRVRIVAVDQVKSHAARIRFDVAARETCATRGLFSSRSQQK